MNSYFLSYQFRVVRRDETVRFIGAIHESLYGKALLPYYTFSQYVDHFGYIYETEEQQRLKAERNLQLLEKELEKNLNDLRMIFYAESYRTNDEKISLIEHALVLVRNAKVKDPYMYYVYNNAVFMYIDCKTEEKILDFSNEFIAMTNPDNAIIIDIYANKGIILGKMGRFAEAEEAIRKYFEYYEKYEKKQLDNSDIVYNRVCYAPPPKKKSV